MDLKMGDIFEVVSDHRFRVYDRPFTPGLWQYSKAAPIGNLFIYLGEAKNQNLLIWSIKTGEYYYTYLDALSKDIRNLTSF